MALDEHMTLAEFRILYPEFCSVEDPQVKANLEQAEAGTDPEFLGDRLKQAHGLLTAHMLAASPFGQQARLDSKQGDTTYRMQLRQLYNQTVLGAALSGGADNVFEDT